MSSPFESVSLHFRAVSVVEPAAGADLLELADGRRLFAALGEVFLERPKCGQLGELFLLRVACEEVEVDEARAVGQCEDGVAVCELCSRELTEEPTGQLSIPLDVFGLDLVTDENAVHGCVSNSLAWCCLELMRLR